MKSPTQERKHVTLSPLEQLIHDTLENHGYVVAGRNEGCCACGEVMLDPEDDATSFRQDVLEHRARVLAEVIEDNKRLVVPVGEA